MALALSLVALRRPWRHALLPRLGAALAVLALSALYAANPGEAVWRLKDYAAAALLFLCCLNAQTPLAYLVPFFWVLLGVILYQRYDTFVLSAQVPGTMVNANLMAAFLLVWLPPLWGEWRQKPHSRFWASGLLSAALALLLLNSAWAVLCALAVAAFLWRRKTALAAALAVLVFGLLREHQTDNFARIAWWDVAWHMWLDHPLLGIGPGGYSAAFLAYKNGPGPNTVFAHNLPLALLAETGLAGATALAAGLAGWWKLYDKERLPYAAGVVALLAYSLVQPALEYPANLLSLAACLAASTKAKASWRPTTLATVLLCALGVAALPVLVSPLLASRAVVSGEQRLAAKDPDSALRAFEGAISLDSLSSRAYYGAARACLIRGDPAQAESYLSRAAALDALNGRFKAELAQVRELMAKKKK